MHLYLWHGVESFHQSTLSSSPTFSGSALCSTDYRRCKNRVHLFAHPVSEPVLLRGSRPVLPRSAVSCKTEKTLFHFWVCPFSVSSQDKLGAVSVSELHEALSLDAVADDRKLFLLAVQMDPEGARRRSCQGLDTVHDLLLQLI